MVFHDQGPPPRRSRWSGRRGTRLTSKSRLWTPRKRSNFGVDQLNIKDSLFSVFHDQVPSCSTKDHHLRGPGWQREGVQGETLPVGFGPHESGQRGHSFSVWLVQISKYCHIFFVFEARWMVFGEDGRNGFSLKYTKFQWPPATPSPLNHLKPPFSGVPLCRV